MKSLALVAVALALVTLGGTAAAHGSRTAQLDVVETAPGDGLVSLRAPASARLAIVPPEGCRIEALEGAAPSQAVRVARLRCPRGLAGAALEIEGLGLDVDVVVARVTAGGEERGAVLTARAPRVALPGRERGDSVVGRYVRLGIEHVLSGLDHVLFLLALVWQAVSAARGALRRAAWELARTATGFTLAHTVTLTGTALGLIRIPADVAEATIALSLVLVALDLGRGAPPRPAARLALATTFGLVHGLGFAGALAESGLPEGAALLGLVAFNGGVEIGQLLLLGATLLALAAARRLVRAETRDRFAARAAALAAYGVGVTGATLLLSRVRALLS